jgi:PAS domain S-box-containing protein
MEEIFNADFMPHGHCYFWRPEIVWTHAISDSIIAIAYSVIPLSLIHIVRKRRDFNYIWMGVLFAIFIIGCGATHVFDVINIWEPWYVTDSILRVITALASIGTAIMLIKVTPEILLIPNAEKWKQVNEELLTSNESLLKSNSELTKTERILKDLNSDLEDRVVKRTEEALKKARDFQFLANAIPQLVWTTDAEGNGEFYNSKYLEYTGLTLEEIQQWGWSKIIHPDQLNTIIPYWKQCLLVGEEYKTEFCLRRFDGSYRWFLVHGLPEKNSDGKIIQWFGTCTDIQDQKVSAKELEAKNSDLRRINNDLDNFIYTASHDLKAPISNMEGILYSIRGEMKNEMSTEISPLFEMMETSIHRLKTTIDDLTDISRIQKSMHEDPEPISVEKILEEYKENHKKQIDECKATIIDKLGETTIQFSSKNFRSVLYNLINNAIKYHHPYRDPVVKISTYKEDDFIVMSIADNGIGFDINQKDKLFGMFKRLHSHVEGSGVGLYIVKRIIENHNGKIDVESEIGKGSTFKVYFPLTGIKF